MLSRPLKILVDEQDIGKTYLVLEEVCPCCGGTGLKFSGDLSPPCDHCTDGWMLTTAGEAILQLVVLHLITPTQYGGILKPAVLRNFFKVVPRE